MTAHLPIPPERALRRVCVRRGGLTSLPTTTPIGVGGGSPAYWFLNKIEVVLVVEVEVVVVVVVVVKKGTDSNKLREGPCWTGAVELGWEDEDQDRPKPPTLRSKISTPSRLGFPPHTSRPQTNRIRGLFYGCHPPIHKFQQNWEQSNINSFSIQTQQTPKGLAPDGTKRTFPFRRADTY